MKAYLLVNFGGPRNLDEIDPFLKELLTDPDVIRTSMPRFLQNRLFQNIAKKRAKFIRKDYELIGGKSPIYFDTEKLREELEKRLRAPVLTFHRYLPATHGEFLQKIMELKVNEIDVLPLFPQFCFATTGSIARFFANHLNKNILSKIRWIHSYANHPSYISAMQRKLSEFLLQHQILEKELLLIFSAHGVPVSFIDTGDIYETECIRSFQKLKKRFPLAQSELCYQSKFGKERWLEPSTEEICVKVESNRKWAVIVPLTFTSDHIETLFEIEMQYIPILKNRGFCAFRCPALNLESYWLDSLEEIIHTSSLSSTQMLIREK